MAARYGYKPPDPIDDLLAQHKAEEGLTKVSAQQFNEILAQHGLKH